MTISRLEILVEERSMEEFLDILIPSVAPSLKYQIYSYNGKPDLLKKLPDRLKGYKKWLPSDWRIMVVLDSDGKDCREIKCLLDSVADASGLITRTAAKNDEKSEPIRGCQVVNRIVVEELEAWYFGDWTAVCEVFPSLNKNFVNRPKYRTPDSISDPCEAMEHQLRKYGYVRPKEHMPKIITAQKIAARLHPDRNTSKSFKCLIGTLKEIASC